MRLSSLILWPTLILSSLLAVEAQAIKPPLCERAWMSPDAFSAGVPTNARLFLSAPDLVRESLSLTSEDNPKTSIPLLLTSAGSLPFQLWLTPGQVLEPWTRYLLSFEDTAGAVTDLHFETGGGPDKTPPQLKSASLAAHVDPSWNTTYAARFDLDGLDDLTPEDRLLYRVDIKSKGGGLHRMYVRRDWPYVANSTDSWCTGSYPGLNPGQTYEAAIAVTDWAGNTSDEAGPIRFQFEQVGPDSGGAAPGFNMGPSALVLLGLVALAIALAYRRQPASSSVLLHPRIIAGRNDSRM